MTALPGLPPGHYERYREGVERLEAFVSRRAPLFPALALERDLLLGRLANFRHHHRHIDKSIVILLLGGTGTGKSTLVNALAGQTISETGFRRGLTDRYIVYHHVEANVSFLGGVTSGADHWVPHQRETLRAKIVIDAPDFDSVKDFNNAKALAMLEVADLVLCLVTSEKYRDRTLHEILRRTGRLKKFYFVYNKIDLDYSEKVEAQLARDLVASGFAEPEVFRISAAKALSAALSGSAADGAGDFERLVRLLHEELDEARVREIKAANLDRLFESIEEQVGRALPADPVAASEELAREFDLALETAGAAIGSKIARGIFAEGHRELADVHRSLQYHSFGGVFGLWLAFVDFVRSLVTGRAGVGSTDPLRLRAAVRRHAEEAPRSHVEREVLALEERLARSASRLGFSEAPVLEALAPARGDGAGTALAERLSAGVADRVGEAFREEFDRLVLKKTGRAAQFALGFVFNILPTGFFLFAAGNLFYRYFWRAQFLGTDYVVSSGVVLVLLCLVSQAMAERYWLRRRWVFLDRLEGEARKAVEEGLEHELARDVREYAELCREAAEEYAGIRAVAPHARGSVESAS
ncbi:MAG: 50S ribosome-binding GTPase [Planctomycetes bacterium]|nr:50S ribosome-binding GTPase [Planctomycetota bacterium]